MKEEREVWGMGGEARPRPDPDPGLWGQALGTEAPREAVGSGGLARARRAACGRHSQLGSFLLWERGRTALLSFFRTEVENVTPCRAPSGRAEVQRQVCCALCIPPCWEGTAAALWAAKARGRSPRNAAVLGWETHPQGCSPPSLDGRPPTTMQGSRLWVAAEFRRHSYPGNAGGQRAGAAGAFGRMTRCAFIHRAQSFVVLHRLPLIHFTDGGTTECQGHFFFGQLEGFCPVRWCALCFPPRGAASPTSPCSKVKHHLLEGFCRRERQGNGGESKIQLWPPSLRHRSPWAQEPWALVQL